MIRTVTYSSPVFSDTDGPLPYRVQNPVNAFWVLIFLLTCSTRVGAQPADTVLVATTPIATFLDARAIAVDPSSNLFVVDAGSNEIIRLRTNGVIAFRSGAATGNRVGLNEPSDIDPTNGLEIYVADTGNARVLKFSRELRLLETIPLQMIDNLAQQIPGVHYHNSDLMQEIDGEPVSVSVNQTQDLFIVDRIQGVVVRWDNARSVKEIFGELDEPEGRLIDPTSVASDASGKVYVADRGQRSVLVYDSFGNYLRTLGGEDLREVRAVSVYRNRLIVITTSRVIVFDANGMRLVSYDVKGEEALVDAVYTDGHLFVLTSGSLFRFSL